MTVKLNLENIYFWQIKLMFPIDKLMEGLTCWTRESSLYSTGVQTGRQPSQPVSVILIEQVFFWDSWPQIGTAYVKCGYMKLPLKTLVLTAFFNNCTIQKFRAKLLDTCSIIKIGLVLHTELLSKFWCYENFNESSRFVTFK